MSNVGILSYGSLIREPGSEIEPLIVKRVECKTPSGVEYGRLSQTRGGGPTVVPHSMGQPVTAEILVLRDGVPLVEAQDLLWRRERRKEGSGERYSPGSSPNSVLVKDWPGYHDLQHVLYTDFNESGKIAKPDGAMLAAAGIQSVSKAKIGKDGLSYFLRVERVAR